MKIRVFIICGLLLFSFSAFAKKKINNVFYAQNTLGWFKNAPQTAQEKARLLKSVL